MARPKLANGYTRIADELIEALASAQLTARQLRIVLAIMRKTYGYGKKKDAISASQLEALTGIRRSKISAVLSELVAAHVIEIEGERQRGRTPTLSIQKDHTRWHRDAPTLGATDAPTLGVTQLTEKPPTWANDTPNLGVSVATHVGSTQETRDTLQERVKVAVRFGGLVPLLSLDEVDRWIAVKPDARTYSRDEVQAWFLQQSPRLSAAGKDPLSSARMLWPSVRADDIRQAVLWVEAQALSAMKNRDERERDSVEAFDEAFFG